MSSAISPTSSINMMTVPVFGGTLWMITKDSSSDYSFRLISYFGREGTYFKLLIKTLEKSRRCAEFLINSPAKLYCSAPKISFDPKPECKGNLSLLFPSSSSLITFVNFCEVTGFLENAGFAKNEQRDVEQDESTQITYVHKETKKDGADLTKFFEAMNKISNIFCSKFTAQRTLCDTNSLVEFRLEKEDCVDSGVSTSNSPSPHPSSPYPAS